MMLTLIKASADGQFGKSVTKARNHQNPVQTANFASLDENQERLRQEIFGSSAFRRLRAEFGNEFEDRLSQLVVPVEGDLTRDDLGVSGSGAELLTHVDAILNCAANVMFDERLDLAVQINTVGPSRLLRLAQQLGGVPFLHLSTAYVSGRLVGTILEEAPSLVRTVGDELRGLANGTLDLDREVEEIDALCERARTDSAEPALLDRLRRELRRDDDEALTSARERWLKDRLVEAGMERARQRGWNDTYTYTKSLGERFLVRDRGAVPLAILRPSIIESSLKEPEPGWIDAMRGADPFFAAFGKGILRDFPADPEALIDFIPVDHVVNASLVALTRLGDDPPAKGEPPRVYQVATTGANSLSFGRLHDLTRDYFLRYPLHNRKGAEVVPPAWKFKRGPAYLKAMQRNLMLLDISVALLKRVPGRLAARQCRRLTRARVQFERLRHYVDIYEPYCNFRARFDTTHTEELFASLGECDRADFDFDPRGFDWKTYIQDVHLPGLLRSLLRDPAMPPMARSASLKDLETEDDS